MNARDRRNARREVDDTIQRQGLRKADPTYTPENDRLWNQEQAMSGGGVAGWRLYEANPTHKREWAQCKITGRWTKELPYTIPKYMPTGAKPPMFDKVEGAFTKGTTKIERTGSYRKD